jgi:hypothetical protein
VDRIFKRYFVAPLPVAALWKPAIGAAGAAARAAGGGVAGSVDEAYKELTARGYTFNEEPYDVPVGQLVTINDPDGNIVGLEDRSKGGLAGVGV